MRMMFEFMERIEKSRADAIEAAKHGQKTPGRRRPGPIDTGDVVEPKSKW